MFVSSEDVHFKHSAALAKTFIDINADFQYKVSELVMIKGKDWMENFSSRFIPMSIMI